MVGQQPRGAVPVLRRLGVPDRFDRQLMGGEPARGLLVQPGDPVRLGPTQLQPQQIREQVVVAEPGAGGVHRDDERVGLLQVLQHPLAAGGSGEQVGQLSVDLLQHAGPQQQPAHRRGLPLQHLGQQVVGHRPLAAGEFRREPVRGRVPGQRQGRQSQPGHPALGPLVQQPERRRGQLDAGRLEQGPRLGPAEPQVVSPDLGQLALEPEAVQAEAQVVPGSEDEPQLRRGPHHQQLELPARRLRAELVQVVDDQPQRFGQRRQVVEQPLHDRPAVQVRRGREVPDQRARGRPAQSVQHGEPEPLRIPLVTAHRHPRDPAGQAGLVDPGAQQHGLAAARRRRHDRHAGRPVQPVPQLRTGDDSLRRAAADGV